MSPLGIRHGLRLLERIIQAVFGMNGSGASEHNQSADMRSVVLITGMSGLWGVDGVGLG
jgi:hypothetical protein